MEEKTCYSDLRCECVNCGNRFLLTLDDEQTNGDKRWTYVKVEGASSCGIYGMNVDCPWCDHRHTL